MAHRHDPSAPSHGHLHAGHRHEHRISSLNRAFLIGIALNVAFVVVEFVVGLCSGSMGLLSDAGHNLSDVASLLLALLAFRLAQAPATPRYTYGYKKSTVLISLLNSMILLVAVGVIVAESVGRLLHPAPIEGGAIAWTAGIGVVVNGFTAWLFMKEKDRDLNVRGAYLHMAADALVSIGVVVSGLVISWTGWTLIDPIVGLAVACVIIASVWSLTRDSLRLSLDGVPDGIDLAKIEQAMCRVEGTDTQRGGSVLSYGIFGAGHDEVGEFVIAVFAVTVGTIPVNGQSQAFRPFVPIIQIQVEVLTVISFGGIFLIIDHGVAGAYRRGITGGPCFAQGTGNIHVNVVAVTPGVGDAV